MPEILHRITREGVAGGWARRGTRGDAHVGGAPQVHSAGGDLDVVTQAADAWQLHWRVSWRRRNGSAPPSNGICAMTAGTPSCGSRTASGGSRWNAGIHCATTWAAFLLSLNALVETGTGRPDPDDVKIDHWH